MVTIEDCVEAEEIVKSDEGIKALLKERYGITDMSMVAADPWFYGDRFGERQNWLSCSHSSRYINSHTLLLQPAWAYVPYEQHSEKTSCCLYSPP